MKKKEKYVWLLIVEIRGDNAQKNIYSVNSTKQKAMNHYKIVYDYRIELGMKIIAESVIPKETIKYYTKQKLEVPFLTTNFQDTKKRDSWESVSVVRYILR